MIVLFNIQARHKCLHVLRLGGCGGGGGAWFGIRVTVELLVTSKWKMPPHFPTLIVRWLPNRGFKTEVLLGTEIRLSKFPVCSYVPVHKREHPFLYIHGLCSTLFSIYCAILWVYRNREKRLHLLAWVTGDCARQNATLLHVAPFKENPSSFLVDENIYRKSTVKKVNLQGFLLINSVQFL